MMEIPAPPPFLRIRHLAGRETQSGQQPPSSWLRWLPLVSNRIALDMSQFREASNVQGEIGSCIPLYGHKKRNDKENLKGEKNSGREERMDEKKMVLCTLFNCYLFCFVFFFRVFWAKIGRRAQWQCAVGGIL